MKLRLQIKSSYELKKRRQNAISLTKSIRRSLKITLRVELKTIDLSISQTKKEIWKLKFHPSLHPRAKSKQIKTKQAQTSTQMKMQKKSHRPVTL